MINLAISVVPILLLIWMMTKKDALPSHIALPVTALIIGLLQLFYFGTDITLISANIIAGSLSAITPISIIAGAILLNRVIALSGAEDVIRQWLEGISRNQTAQLMIIGWAFAFMIEGASGFGTPAAIAAPILVGLGFNPLKVAMLALVMNSVPVSFGAVGTPTWFGFSSLGLNEDALMETGRLSALLHSIAAFIIPVIALKFVVSWQEIRRNLLFIQLSVLSCTVPYLLFAQWNYEFPSLIGGAIGLTLSILLARYNIGLETPESTSSVKTEQIPFKTILKAMSPTLLLILILIVTRIQQLGIKGMLTDNTPLFNLSLGFSDLSVSQALIIKLSSILGTETSWAYKTLYVPALIPFLLVILISIPVLGMQRSTVKQAFTETASRIKMPFIALVGALIMVKFMMIGGDKSPIMTTGQAFSNLMGANWQWVASYLGALGAFFSGSATVSNLTFGGIQQTIAMNVALPETTILALQSVGASMGNMVCINNIIAVSTILGIANKEGYIIKRTVVPMVLYGVIVGLASAFV
ncbi:L-lactate permease [Photobacterium alginatilyticum]|uniref:L-lactate permease n=1 Tax=Photobacterium alginatilyticum TaxID=1775171 RepID=A0ABW9YBR2_9GAMM|nr:L-lactate permease [Photobacterium alginatilyticum]NBI51146.1 L-lactate permease [Photobacterium alginatilyticum]